MVLVSSTCCGGPGIIRAPGIGYLTNDNTPISAPCWFDDSFTGFVQGGLYVDIDSDPVTAVTLFHVMGYDSDKDWIWFAQPNGYQIAALFGGFPTDIQNVYRADVRTCTAGSPNYLLGTEVFDDTAAKAIMDSVAPADVDGVNDRWFRGWSSVGRVSGEWRLYFFWTWYRYNSGPPDDEGGFSVHSVLYDGTDLQTHVNIELTGSPFYGKPVTMNVIEDEVFTAVDNGDGTGKILTNGSGGSSIAGIDGTATGCVWKGTQLAFRAVFSGGLGGGLFTTTDGSIYLGYTDGDSNDWLLAPVSMGYSFKFQALVILFAWVDPGGWPWLADPAIPPIVNAVAICTGPIADGNVVSQDGVSIYDLGEYIGGLGLRVYDAQTAMAWLTFIDYCTLPTPSDLIPYEAPDPPVVFTCDTYDDVTAQSGTSLLIYHGGYNIGGCTVGSVVYESTILQGSRTFLSAAQLVASDPGGGANAYLNCVTNSPGNFGYLWCDFYTSTDPATRYADPGVLWKTDTDPGVTKDEYYVAAEYIETSCDNGYTTITAYHILEQIFQFTWETDHWELVGAVFGNPVVLCFAPFTSIVGTPIGSPMRGDGTSIAIMATTFESSDCSASPNFTIQGTITPPGT